MWKVNLADGFFYYIIFIFFVGRLFICLFVSFVCCLAAFANIICLIKLKTESEKERIHHSIRLVPKVTREEYRTWCELCVILSARAPSPMYQLRVVSSWSAVYFFSTPWYKYLLHI